MISIYITFVVGWVCLAGILAKRPNYLDADAWSDNRRGEDGRLRPHPRRFISGIAALAEHVHERGDNRTRMICG